MRFFQLSLLLVVAAWATSVSAAEKILSGKEIAELLPGIVASGENTRQTFSKAGATNYTDRGRDTYGTWRVQGNQYCSQWPPAGGWSCYDVSLRDDGKHLIWIDPSGNRTLNTISKK